MLQDNIKKRLSAKAFTSFDVKNISVHSWVRFCSSGMSKQPISVCADLQWNHVGSVLPPDAQVVHQELQQVESLLFPHVEQQHSGHKADALAVANLWRINKKRTIYNDVEEIL